MLQLCGPSLVKNFFYSSMTVSQCTKQLHKDVLEEFSVEELDWTFVWGQDTEWVSLQAQLKKEDFIDTELRDEEDKEEAEGPTIILQLLNDLWSKLFRSHDCFKAFAVILHDVDPASKKNGDHLRKVCFLTDHQKSEHFGEEFGKISILRKVPVLKDGTFILTESVAILQYLVKKFSTPDHWYPADLQKRARADEFLSWQHSNLRTHASKIFWFRGVMPALTGAPVPKEKMDPAMEELNTTLKLFEDKFIQDRPFIIGEKISLADLVAIVEIMQPVGTGLDVFQGRPVLSAWRDRVKKEISVDLFDEAHKTIMNIDSLSQRFENQGLPEFLKIRLQKMYN